MPDLDGILDNVSRETLDDLRRFERLVEKWTQRINLISRNSQSEIWDRHILDSAQLFELAPDSGTWLDLGSGGGFPGLVVGILRRSDIASRGKITLVESDGRKCAFLSTAVREFGLNVDVMNMRIEELKIGKVQILSARALAPLPDLLTYASHFLHENGLALVPKGKNWKKEVESALLKWSFDLDVVQSKTDSEAVILKIQNIQSKGDYGAN